MNPVPVDREAAETSTPDTAPDIGPDTDRVAPGASADRAGAGCPMRAGAIPLPRDRTSPFDPPPEYTALRAGCPVAPLELTVGPGDGAGWLVSRLAEARAVLSDRRFSHRNELIGLPLPPPFPLTEYTPPPAAPGAFIKMDQPDHSRYRRLITRRFTMRGIAELTPMITRITGECLEGMADAGGPVDLVRAFAEPVPVRVMCAMLGVPESDQEPLNEHLGLLSRMSYTLEELITACTVIGGRLQELVEAKRADPGDDLLSDLARGDKVTDEELVNIAWALLGGGFDTTMNMLALGTFALLTHPEQLAALRARPDLVDNAVEELLRYLTISHFGASRAALEDVELNGTRIKAGDTVVVALPAANRDPEHFASPDRLDITAVTQGHVAFGHGEHQCIGQHLARSVLRIAYPALFERFPSLRLATPVRDVPLRGDMLHYGVHELLVTWDGAPG